MKPDTQNVPRAPRYTIVIPTKDRLEYLPFTIESVLRHDRDDIELIVSDNLSIDGTANYLAGVSDPRVRVVRPPIQLPMSLHYEYAVAQARGDWMTILGDDDALMPLFFDRIDRLSRQYPGISMISSERAYYFWEGCEDLYGDVVVSYRRRPGEKVRSTKRDLMSALAGIRSCFNLPQIYTSCIVKRSLIDRVKDHCDNRLYYSIIPDMYSAVALSLTEDFYLRVDEPLFWTGTSNKSMGRGNRIYNDSEIVKTACNPVKSAELTLNRLVPQNIHSRGFGCLYLYEALLQCPLAKGIWKSKLVHLTVYSAVVISAKTRFNSDKVDQEALRKEIREGINNVGVSRAALYAFVPVLFMFTLLHKLFSLPSRLGWRMSRLVDGRYLLSRSRADFPDISAASRAVSSLSKS